MKSIYVIIFIALFTACTKKVSPPPGTEEPVTGLVLNVSYHADQVPLVADSFIYTTQAGYQYSVNNLIYYLSRISLIKQDSSLVEVKDYLFMDAFNANTNKVVLGAIPAGNYIGLKFNIGLDPKLNRTDSLPTTVDNINMQWPMMMGGGYHFMKFEGYFKDQGKSYGFNMHLGTDTCLISVKLYKAITITEGTKTPIFMNMNINEWFRNPAVFDFNTDGNYIMGNVVAMKKFANNGVDVFKF